MPSPDRDVRTGLLSAAAYAGMFVFGMVMALLGAVLPSLSERLQFRVADIGTLFLVMNFAMLGCSLLLGAGDGPVRHEAAATAGPLLVGAALLLIARAGDSMISGRRWCCSGSVAER